MTPTPTTMTEADGWKLVPAKPTEDALDAIVQGTRASVSYADARDSYEALLDTLSAAPPAPEPVPVHADDLAVDLFAAAMKAKLAKKRAEGRGGWEDKDECSQSFLSELLREHVDKGDPVDVGNLAMMLHQRNERITASDKASLDAIASMTEDQV